MDIKQFFVKFADKLCESDEGIVGWLFNNPGLLEGGDLLDALTAKQIPQKHIDSMLRADTAEDVLSNKHGKKLLITLRGLFKSHVDNILGCVNVEGGGGNLSIYRQITVEDPKEYLKYLKGQAENYSHYIGLGNFWCYDRGKASSYFGSTGGTPILLEAEVPMDEINLEETFYKWLNPVLGEAEAEIYLDSGVSVFLKKVVLTENGDEHQIERSLTV